MAEKREGHQIFTYLTPQLNLNPHDLLVPPSPFATPQPPEIIHVVTTTERGREVADEMQRVRAEGWDGYGKGWKAKVVWEPLGVS